jgi:hypothetical protein
MPDAALAWMQLSGEEALTALSHTVRAFTVRALQVGLHHWVVSGEQSVRQS